MAGTSWLFCGGPLNDNSPIYPIAPPSLDADVWTQGISYSAVSAGYSSTCALKSGSGLIQCSGGSHANNANAWGSQETLMDPGTHHNRFCTPTSDGRPYLLGLILPLESYQGREKFIVGGIMVASPRQIHPLNLVGRQCLLGLTMPVAFGGLWTTGRCCVVSGTC